MTAGDFQSAPFRLPRPAADTDGQPIGLVLEGSRIGAWEWLVCQGEVSLNRHWGDAFGAKHFGAGLLEDVLHPDDCERIARLTSEFLSGKVDRAEVEIRVRDRKGGWRWMLARVRTVESDDAKKPLRVVGIHIDITDQKSVETALRDSEERYRALVESASDAIMVFDAMGVCRFLNGEAATRFGAKPDELVGRSMYELFPADIAAPQAEAVRRVIRTGQRSVEDSVTVLKGEARLYHTSLQPLRLASGERAALLVARDVTERQRAQYELTGLNAQLTERAAQLRALAAELTRAELRERQRVSEVLHDHVQQTLAAAKLHLGMLRDHVNTREGEALMEQVSELLSASVAAVRTLAVEISPRVLKEGTLSAALEWLADECRKRQGLTVRLEVDPRCAEPAGDARLMLFQAVRELLFNVAKHARVGIAAVSATTKDGRLAVSVTDSGAGFVTAAQSPSTGFGLFSIRERLEAVGGTLVIESTPGSGTRVDITIPLEPTSAAAAATDSGR